MYKSEHRKRNNNFLLNLDAFQSTLHFNLPNGIDSLPSWIGFGFTVILFTILGIYGALEMLKLVKHNDSYIVHTSKRSYFDDKYEFNLDKWENGLEIAFAFTANDNEPMLDEPDYGELQLIVKTWDAEGEDSTLHFTKKTFHPCT